MLRLLGQSPAASARALRAWPFRRRTALRLVGGRDIALLAPAPLVAAVFLALVVLVLLESCCVLAVVLA